MKLYKLLAAMTVLFLVAPIAAKADAIYHSTFTAQLGNSSPAAELAFLQNYLENDELQFLAKIPDEDEDNDSLIAGFEEAAVDLNYGTVSWDISDTGYALWYILLKGPNNFSAPGLESGTLYTLYWVTESQYLSSGDQEIGFVSGFDELQNPIYYGRDISHISFFGGEEEDITVPPPHHVPEPSTLLLIGTGVLGLGIFGRKKLRK